MKKFEIEISEEKFKEMKEKFSDYGKLSENSDISDEEILIEVFDMNLSDKYDESVFDIRDDVKVKKVSD